MVAVHLPLQSDAAAGGVVPCGFTAAGLPVALQLVGRRFDDATVLRAARAYENAHPFRMPPIRTRRRIRRPRALARSDDQAACAI
jgi:Asp-tRNA(Asn)/Glu-tRNA(Gln) amidotransferase A subunit family amidase